MPDRLEQAITVLQTRFGSAAPRPAAPPCPTRPSGLAEIDALTGVGGWPVGRLSLLAGQEGSGKRALGQGSVAVTSRDGVAASVDFRLRPDPALLARCRARLERLVVGRRQSLQEELA